MGISASGSVAVAVLISDDGPCPAGTRETKITPKPTKALPEGLRRGRSAGDGGHGHLGDGIIDLHRGG